MCQGGKVCADEFRGRGAEARQLCVMLNLDGRDADRPALRHSAIKEQDFLQMSEDDNREKWDLISLSLVVNFVPDPKDRGRAASSWLNKMC